MSDEKKFDGKKILIVSRHPATISWLREHCAGQITITDHVDVNYEFSAYDDVIGNVPLALAKEITAQVGGFWAVEYDSYPPRGKELTAMELDKYGIKIVFYRVY